MAYLKAAGPRDNGWAVVWEQDEGGFFSFLHFKFSSPESKDTNHKTE